MKRVSFSNIVSGAVDVEDKRWIDSNELYTQSEIIRAGVRLFRQLGEDTQIKRVKSSYIPSLDRYHKDGINGKSLREAYEHGLLDPMSLKHIYDSYARLRTDLKKIIVAVDMDHDCGCKDCFMGKKLPRDF